LHESFDLGLYKYESLKNLQNQSAQSVSFHPKVKEMRTVYSMVKLFIIFLATQQTRLTGKAFNCRLQFHCHYACFSGDSGNKPGNKGSWINRKMKTKPSGVSLRCRYLSVHD